MKGEIVNLSNSSSTFINNGAIVEIPKVSANIIDVDVYGRVNFLEHIQLTQQQL